MRFPVDRAWFDARPTRRKRSLLVSAAITGLILVLSSFVHAYVFACVAALSIIYWVFEVRAKFPQPHIEDWYVEISEKGLVMSAPRPDGQPAIKATTPWQKLSLEGVSRKRGEVVRIKLVDKELPTGVRTHILENYENMGSLLEEIEKRLG